MKINLGEWLDQARSRLQDGREPPELALLEAQVLAGHVLQHPRAWVLAHPEQMLTAEQQDQLNDMIHRLKNGEPLPYLTGQQEFYGLMFEVNPNVLIPRPETELLVEEALRWLAIHRGRRRVADVGTGSGSIAVTLARNVPDLAVLAVDRSFAALEIARRNAVRQGVDHLIDWAQFDLLTAVRGPFDLVCANLPYIPDGLLDTLDVARFEPQLALSGGERGLDAIERLLLDAPRWLARHGLMLLEIEAGQGKDVSELAERAFPNGRVSVRKDLAGHDRLVRIANGGED